MKWRIYYADGTVFDDKWGRWEDAPTDGVVCVVRKDEENGSVIMHGVDHYLYPPGHDEPIMTDDLGPQLRALRWIKFGLWVPRETYHEVMGRALHDPDFPRKGSE